VLGVKPAFEDVNADRFLAFRFALLKTKSNPTPTRMGIDWFMWLLTLWSSYAASGNSSPVSSRVGAALKETLGTVQKHSMQEMA